MKKKTFKLGDRLCGLCAECESVKDGDKTVIQADGKRAVRCGVKGQSVLPVNKCSDGKFTPRPTEAPIPLWERVGMYALVWAPSIVRGLLIQTPCVAVTRLCGFAIDDFANGVWSKLLRRVYSPAWLSKLFRNRLAMTRPSKQKIHYL